MFVCLFVYIHTYIHMCVHVHVYVEHANTCAHVRCTYIIHVYIYRYIHIRGCAYARVLLKAWTLDLDEKDGSFWDVLISGMWQPQWACSIVPPQLSAVESEGPEVSVLCAKAGRLKPALRLNNRGRAKPTSAKRARIGRQEARS